MDLKAVIEAGTEGASSLKESAAQVVEEVGDRAAQVLAAVREGSDSVAEAAGGTTSTSWRRSAVKPVLLGAAALAAVGAGLVVWKRRRDAAVADLSGETPWAVPTPAPEREAEPEAATDAAPTKSEKSFGAQLDEVADHIAEDLVDSIETTGGDAEAAIEAMDK